ncbi:unnamed protein product, partial [Didymodactylos carnosus]
TNGLMTNTIPVKHLPEIYCGMSAQLSISFTEKRPREATMATRTMATTNETTPPVPFSPSMLQSPATTNGKRPLTITDINQCQSERKTNKRRRLPAASSRIQNVINPIESIVETVE